MLYNQKITGMAKVHWTPEGWRCEKKGEHLYRAQWMDYRSPAIQMLTMVTLNRLPLLGELRGEEIVLSPLGQKVSEEIERIPTYKGASSIEIYKYVIMPDHVHILLRVHDRLPMHIGQYVRWFKYHYKPQGVYFEACAAGKLLLVEPNAEAFEHQDIVARVTAKIGTIPHTTLRYPLWH